MPLYLTHLWLTFRESNTNKDTARNITADAHDEYRKRFSELTELAWWSKPFIAEDSLELAALLNQQILDDCRKHIEADTEISAIQQITSIPDDGWTEGNGGQHETKTDYPIDVLQPSKKEWSFKHDSKDYLMTARAVWIQLTDTSKNAPRDDPRP